MHARQQMIDTSNEYLSIRQQCELLSLNIPVINEDACILDKMGSKLAA